MSIWIFSKIYQTLAKSETSKEKITKLTWHKDGDLGAVSIGHTVIKVDHAIFLTRSEIHHVRLCKVLNRILKVRDECFSGHGRFRMEMAKQERGFRQTTAASIKILMKEDDDEFGMIHGRRSERVSTMRI